MVGSLFRAFCSVACHTLLFAYKTGEKEIFYIAVGVDKSVQIKLVPVNAPYFDGANLLVAADCTAFAYGNFHNDFIRNHVTLMGCPKLDSVDYTDKLTEIIANNNIKSVTVVRMEVPCCGGIEHAVKKCTADKWPIHSVESCYHFHRRQNYRVLK